MLLPEIPEATCKRVIDLIPRDPAARKKYLYAELDRIEKINPQIARYLRNSIGKNTKTFLDTPDELVWTIYAGIVVFQLLESEIKIPQITRDTCESLLVEHNRAIKAGGEAVNEWLTLLARELKEENRYILQTLHGMTGNCQRNDARILVFYNGIFIYKLVKSKIEADILDQKFFPED